MMIDTNIHIVKNDSSVELLVHALNIFHQALPTVREVVARKPAVRDCAMLYEVAKAVQHYFDSNSGLLLDSPELDTVNNLVDIFRLMWRHSLSIVCTIDPDMVQYSYVEDVLRFNNIPLDSGIRLPWNTQVISRCNKFFADNPSRKTFSTIPASCLDLYTILKIAEIFNIPDIYLDSTIKLPSDSELYHRDGDTLENYFDREHLSDFSLEEVSMITTISRVFSTLNAYNPSGIALLDTVCSKISDAIDTLLRDLKIQYRSKI
tara:strand:+ start:5664 stop:6449 length:786 start_codon:yes stop_codon:yes gene_type:complete